MTYTEFAVISGLVGCASFLHSGCTVYICVQVVIGRIAFLIGETKSIDSVWWKRWLCALSILIPISATKQYILTTYVEDYKWKCFLYAFTAFWDCSNIALVFGGSELLRAYGIISYKRAILAALCPCQVKFVEKYRYIQNEIRLVDLVTYSALGGLVYVLLYGQNFMATIGEILPVWLVTIVNLELVIMLLSCGLVIVFDLPGIVYQMIFSYVYSSSKDKDHLLQTILPVGNLYCSFSVRQFWSRWSRPAGQVYRYAFLKPLGGTDSPYFLITIPLTFFVNAASHYDISAMLVGEKMEKYWNIVFGLLAFNTTLEVFCDKLYFFSKAGQWYVYAKAAVFLVTIRIVAYVFLKYCMKLEIL